jgi:hypothetical protein
VADDAECPALFDFLLSAAIRFENRRRRFRGAGWLKIHDHFPVPSP